MAKMESNNYKKTLTIIVALLIVFSGFNTALLWLHITEKAEMVTASSEKYDILSMLGIKTMTMEFSFF